MYSHGTFTLAPGTHSLTIQTIAIATGFPDGAGYLRVDTSGVEIDINDTPDKSDNITLFNPIPLTQAYTQTIPAKITNLGITEGTFQLSVNPPGAATLSQTSVELGGGASTEITITPQADSSAPNDVHIIAQQGGTEVGEDDMTIVSVTFSQNIYNPDTPSQMISAGQYRIPPSMPTPVNVTVTPSLSGSGQVVTLAVNGQNANNGTLTINGNVTQDITSGGNVNLQGTSQTVPGNAGNLNLVVRVRGQDTIQSNGFSVSAIPVSFQQSTATQLAGGVLQFTYSWNSDSGNLADLDEVWIGEYVTYSDGGIHAGAGRPWMGNNPDPTITPSRATYKATDGEFVDTHSPPGRFLPTAGPADSFTATQFYGFHDFRTDNRPGDNTHGWQVDLMQTAIVRYVENIGTAAAPVWQYRITKSGSTNTAPLTRAPMDLQGGPSDSISNSQPPTLAFMGVEPDFGLVRVRQSAVRSNSVAGSKHNIGAASMLLERRKFMVNYLTIDKKSFPLMV